MNKIGKLLTLILFAALTINSAFAQAKKEKKQSSQNGWITLFDGTSLDKWKGYKKDTPPSGWKIEDNALTLVEKGAGDIITKDEFENFELELEWKIAEGGNSGIIFLVHEDEKYKNTYDTGPEMQVLDNERHPDAKAGKNGNRKAGSLYDMIPASKASKPAGEWNKIKLVVNNGKAAHYLNGEKVVEYTLWTPEWNKMVEESKFKGWPGFGKYKKGHIALQDHGDKVSYRNIRIKKS